MANEKTVHSIVLDTGPLLLNQPSISSLLDMAEQIYTVPSVITEIRDPSARSRLDTTVLPFLKIREPSPKSIKAVSEFAQKTGDFAVLSGPDLQVLALAYELECERSGGDWRLRKTPGQKVPDAPNRIAAESSTQESKDAREPSQDSPSLDSITGKSDNGNAQVDSPLLSQETQHNNGLEPASTTSTQDQDAEGTARAIEQLSVEPEKGPAPDADPSPESSGSGDTEVGDTELGPTEESTQVGSESDGEGWITPSNLKRHQAKDANVSSKPSQPLAKIEVATLTTDYALQNTLLLMNLHLLSSSLSRISHLKSHVLRCHACFATSKQMDRQFCARCGKPTLTRVTCTTSANGEFKLHLKKNMQWNSRGDRYSIPKPTQGSSSGKQGKDGRNKGGKGGWGKELIFSEDQKEYTRALSSQKRQQVRDLMDEDYLPNILSGARSSTAKIKVGAGRDVNARKR